VYHLVKRSLNKVIQKEEVKFMDGKFISYIRVSTAKQGASGLGLEAQQKAVADYLNGGNWELLQEFREVESGKRNDRPELQKALAACRATGAQLIVAKLDRLARNVAFVSALMESGVAFTAVDFPQANRLTVHMLAAVAEHEAAMVSQRTIAALAAARERGVVLGTDNLTEDGRIRGQEAGRAARIRRADQFARERHALIQDLRSQGMSYRQIAEHLTEKKILTASGKATTWTASGVQRIVKRFESNC
jgi:DNA invertase Pin-like site-specific DNA recombinase